MNSDATLHRALTWQGLADFNSSKLCPSGAYGSPKAPTWQYRNDSTGAGRYSIPVVLTWTAILLPMLMFWFRVIYRYCADGIKLSRKNIQFKTVFNRNGSALYGYNKLQMFALVFFATFAAIAYLNIAYDVPGFNGLCLLWLALAYFITDFYLAAVNYQNSSFSACGMFVCRTMIVQLGDLLIVVALLIFTHGVYGLGFQEVDGHEDVKPRIAGVLYFVFLALGFIVRGCASAHNLPSSSSEGSKPAAMFPLVEYDLANPARSHIVKEVPANDLVVVMANYEYWLVHGLVFLGAGGLGLSVAYRMHSYAQIIWSLIVVPVLMIASSIVGYFLYKRPRVELMLVNIVCCVAIIATIAIAGVHARDVYDAIDKAEGDNYEKVFHDKVDKNKDLLIWFTFFTTLFPLFGISTYMV
jgi:hypothetical protein